MTKLSAEQTLEVERLLSARLATQVPGVVCQLVIEIGKGRSLSFQTAFDQNEKPEAIDSILDVLVRSANRQAIKRDADQREEGIWELELQEAEDERELLIQQNMPVVEVDKGDRVRAAKGQVNAAAVANANRESAIAQHRQQVQAVRRNIGIEKKRLARLQQLMNGKDHAAEA